MVKAPDSKDVMVFASAAEFHAWLEKHHASESEAWVGYYKKHVAKQSITYPESVDEALCFGWIDGITYRISDEVHAARFTPRTKRSNWSVANVRRVGELAAEGRMHPAGLAAFEGRTPERTGVYSYENRPADLPSAYLKRLKSNTDAWRFWQARSPSYRRAATWWVVSAKQEKTREGHLATLIEDSAAGRVIKPLEPRPRE